jgi:hypothetical protein
MSIGKQATLRRTAVSSSGIRPFYPRATIRCEGARVFRSQAVRDVGCLLTIVIEMRMRFPTSRTEAPPLEYRSTGRTSPPPFPS